MQANEELSDVPVVVSYENRRSARVTLEYRLRIVAFAEVTKVELEFIAER